MGIFDVEVKRACTECPRLLIKTINSIFSRCYDENAEVKYLNTEQLKEETSNFMDLLVDISGDKFHLEFQLLEGNMAIRMYEYAVHETVRELHQANSEDKYEIDNIMPQQSVVFLAGANKRNSIVVNLSLPDRKKIKYELPCVSAAESVGSLCQRELYLFIPFQQVQMEQRLNMISTASVHAKVEAGNTMKDYRNKVLSTLETLKNNDILKEQEYNSLYKCFRNIEKYLLHKDTYVKEVANMGDNVKPWSDELIEEGYAKAKAESEALIAEKDARIAEKDARIAELEKLLELKHS